MEWSGNESRSRYPAEIVVGWVLPELEQGLLGAEAEYRYAMSESEASSG